MRATVLKRAYTRARMEDFQPPTADVRRLRDWMVFLALMPLMCVALLGLWYSARPLCLILSPGADCPSVREHYALYFMALTPYALTCMLASALRYSTHEGAIKAVVRLSWFAVLALVALVLITALVPHEDWEDWLWLGASSGFLAALIALKVAVFLYKRAYKRFLKRALKNIFRGVTPKDKKKEAREGMSYLELRDAAQVPIMLERQRQGLLRLFYADILVVAVFLLAIFVFQILPGSWKLISMHTLFFVLSLTALHLFLVPYRRLIVGLQSARDQIDDTILLPLSRGLVVLVENAVLADAALLTVNFVYIFTLIVQAPEVDIVTFVVAVSILAVVGAMLTIDAYTVFATRLLYMNITKYITEVEEIYPQMARLPPLREKDKKRD